MISVPESVIIDTRYHNQGEIEEIISNLLASTTNFESIRRTQKHIIVQLSSKILKAKFEEHLVEILQFAIPLDVSRFIWHVESDTRLIDNGNKDIIELKKHARKQGILVTPNKKRSGLVITPIREVVKYPYERSKMTEAAKMEVNHIIRKETALP